MQGVKPHSSSGGPTIKARAGAEQRWPELFATINESMMTLEEYAQSVGSTLRNAHNRKDMASAEAGFREADRTLTESNISQIDRKRFWENVRQAFFSGQLLVEKQANSSLIALMRAIEQGLKAREGK
jgi:hypothetical protein